MTARSETAVAAPWDRLMRLQTDLAQPVELPFFFGSGAWREAERVLDLGTGNAYYLRGLARYFPGKRYVGIDADPAHVEVARHEYAGGRDGGAAMEFMVGDALHVQGEYDVALARLLVQHLPSIEDFLGSMRRAIRPGGTLVVIESADEERRFVPPLPSMERFFEVLRANRRADGCDRDAGRMVADRARDAGFEPEENALVLVPSTIPGHKELFGETYRTVLAVVGAAFRLPFEYEALAEDLARWQADPPAYTQLGVHLASYRRRP